MKINLILILIILLFVSNFIFGQTITESNYFQIGTEYLRKEKIDIELEAVSVGDSGANVTWDFSNVNFDHSSILIDTLSCITPDGTPFFNEPSINYNTSNFSIRLDEENFSIEDNTFYYYRIENDSLSFIGDWADNPSSDKWFYSYSDLRTELIFPINYNDNHTDFFEGSYLDLSGSDWHYLQGSVEVVVDGYGTLITPYNDSIQNAIRIKEIINTVDSNLFFGVQNFIETKYYWYSSDEEGPIMQINMHPTQSDLIVNAYYIRKLGIVTSVTEKVADENQFQVFPNPASTLINLNIGDIKYRQVSIYNSIGQLVKRINKFADAKTQLDINDLRPGVYFIELRDQDKFLGRKKIIIQ